MISTAAKRARLLAIIKDRSVIRAEHGENIVTPRGGKGAWLLDLRKTFMHGEGLQLAAELFWERYAKELPFQIGGLEAGSIPLVSAIILEGERRGTPVNGFFVRKERKQHGRQHRIEGEVTGDPVVVVDDLMNAGGTLDKVVTALDEVGTKVNRVFVVTNYQSQTGKRYLQKQKVVIDYLFTLADVGLARNFTKKPVVDDFAFRRCGRFVPGELGRFHVVPKSTPALDRERMYFGTDAGIFFALDQDTLQPVWQFDAGNNPQRKGIFSSPVSHRGRVYFGSYSGNVFCLDAATGHEIWHFSGAEWVGSSPALAPDLGLLFIGLEHAPEGRRGSIVALDMKTGEKVWEHETQEYLHGSPAYCAERKLVIIGTNDATLLLFDAQTGRQKWAYTAGGPMKYRPAFDLAHNQVIVGSHDGCLHAVSITTGKKKWIFHTEDVIYAEPLIIGNYAFIGSTDKSFYKVHLKTGKGSKLFESPGRFLASPRKIGQRIFLGSTSGDVYAFDLEGQLRAKIQLPDRVTNAICYAPRLKKYFALSCENTLFTFTRT